MNRVSIRLRLALAFALAMAVVLAVVGALLYVRLGDSLQEQIDDGLEGLSESVATLAASGNLVELTGEEALVQVLGPGDRVLSQPPALDEPVISEAEKERASDDGAFFLTRGAVAGFGGAPVRLRVSSTVADGEQVTVVVGASLDDRQEALDGLLAQLLLVGPLALLLSSLAGYFLAAAALRPVDAMRRRAAEVSSEQPGQRLPLPRAHDEIRRLGETLNEMLARLEAGLARERRFVADASHELRTPLSLLQTELELALRRPRSPDEQQRALRSAAEEVDRLVRLAGDLLVLARADEGKLLLSLERHYVREVLDAVAGRFDQRARAAGRTLEVEAPPDWVISGDRLRLEQALGNLVDNALRHGAGTIRISAAQEDGWFELAVSDEGAGFPDEFLPQAFERFSRAEVARSGGGSGLGLGIVEAIARAHGGSATATNTTDGPAIQLRLPTDLGRRA